MKYRWDNIETEGSDFTPGTLAEDSSVGTGTMKFAHMHLSTQYTSAADDASLNTYSKGT